MTKSPSRWDIEVDAIVIGYGFVGATAAITAHDAGAKGWIKAAGTLHGLAGLIDVPAAALTATVERFGEFAAVGKDPQWDRAADKMAALTAPPCYAMELTPAFVNTQGGPRRDEHARVIGADGAPIGRLYSAGELGSIYSFLHQGGGNIGECFAFGRIAGRNAASEAPVAGTEQLLIGAE